MPAKAGGGWARLWHPLPVASGVCSWEPAYAPRRRRTRIPSKTVPVVCRMSPSMSSVPWICLSMTNDAVVNIRT